MSTTRKTTRPTVNTDVPSSEENEVLEGEVIDSQSTDSDGPVKHFLKKYKTWLIATGAAAAGFVAHAFLTSGEDDTSCCELETGDDEMYIEVTPEQE